MLKSRAFVKLGSLGTILSTNAPLRHHFTSHLHQHHSKALQNRLIQWFCERKIDWMYIG